MHAPRTGIYECPGRGTRPTTTRRPPDVRTRPRAIWFSTKSHPSGSKATNPDRHCLRGHPAKADEVTDLAPLETTHKQRYILKFSHDTDFRKNVVLAIY
eukprot:3154281-Pyramimonas_sp.AAC.1